MKRKLPELVMIFNLKNSKIKIYTYTLLICLFYGSISNGQTQIGNDIDGEAASDFFGWSTAISSNGNRIIIGAKDNDEVAQQAGHARVYEWDGTSWIQLGNDIDGLAEDDEFGHSVSISSNGNRIAIGATQSFSFDLGYVKVLEWNGTTWNQVGSDLVGDANGDEFGYSVSLSGDGERLAIGAIGNDTNGGTSGQVEVFEWNGANWQPLGQVLNGTGAGVRFGVSVCLSNQGNALSVSAEESDGKGSVTIFDFNSTQWVQRGAKLEGDAGFNLFGFSQELSSDATRLVAGALFNDTNAEFAGQAKVYQWNGTNWTQLGLDLLGQNAQDQFGSSVSISENGNRIAIGARYEDTTAGNDTGVTRIYDWSGTSWNTVGTAIEGEAANDDSGQSLALSGNGSRVIIGAIGNDDAGSGAGQVRAFQLLPLSINRQANEPVAIYPNPFKDYLEIKSTADIISVEVYDMFGKFIHKTASGSVIHISHLTPGVYIIKVNHALGFETLKVTKI